MNIGLGLRILQKLHKALVTSHKSSIQFSAQNNGWKLVGYSFKIGALLQTIIGFPIGNVRTVKYGLARSYAKVVRKMTCDRSLF